MKHELDTILRELSKPFDTIKWKVQTANEKFVICVAYIDARDVQARLDQACVWQDRYKDLGNGKIYCEIGILIGDQWVWRSDTGTAGNIEKEKAEASDAFKRAAVKWGIGRYIYDVDVYIFKNPQQVGKTWVPITHDAKALKFGNQISDYINKQRGGKSKLESLLGTELEGIKNATDYKEFTRSLQPIFNKRKAGLNA